MLCSHVFSSIKSNTAFRRVVFTGKHQQLVFMNIQPGEDVGWEIHKSDEVLILIQGSGQMVIEGELREIIPGDAVLIKAKAWHNFTNNAQAHAKLMILYGPPLYHPDVVHATKSNSIVGI